MMLGPLTKMRPTSRSASTLPSAPRTSRRWPGSTLPHSTKRRARRSSVGSAAGRARWAGGGPVDHVGANTRAVRAKGDGEADLGHAVARDEGLAIEAHPLERLGEAVEHVGPDHVAADAGVAPAREVEVGWQLVGGAAGGEVVAEARAVSDGAAVVRDQVEPLRRPARE